MKGFGLVAAIAAVALLGSAPPRPAVGSAAAACAAAPDTLTPEWPDPGAVRASCGGAPCRRAALSEID